MFGRSFVAPAATAASVAAAIVAAGGASAADAQTFTTRDSAGIQIVSSAAPSRTGAQALRIDPAPLLVIGTRAAEPYELSRVRGAARLADGKVVIADGASLQLRLYDSLGTYIRAAGGRGGGPGEFEQMNQLFHLRGDTIAVIGRVGTVSYFDRDLAFLFGVNHLTAPATPGGPGLRPVLAAFADGTNFVTTIRNPAPRAVGARWIHSAPISLVDRRSDVLRSLGEFPLDEVEMGASYPAPLWFSARLAFANTDDAFFIGFGSEYSIRMYTRDGRLTRIIRRAWTPTRVTMADIDTYVVEWGKRWIRSSGAAAAKEREDLRDDAYATAIPAYSQLIADRAGRLWVRTPHLADAPGNGQLNTLALVPSVWSVFDREGRWLNDVTLPANFTPSEIGSDYVIGVARDADDVQTVVRYRLRP